MMSLLSAPDNNLLFGIDETEKSLNFFIMPQSIVRMAEEIRLLLAVSGLRAESNHSIMRSVM